MIKAGALAIVEIEGKKYYDDIRMQEYRHVDDFSDKIKYADIGDRKVKVIQERKEWPEKKVRDRNERRRGKSM